MLVPFSDCSQACNVKTLKVSFLQSCQIESSNVKTIFNLRRVILCLRVYKGIKGYIRIVFNFHSNSSTSPSQKKWGQVIEAIKCYSSEPVYSPHLHSGF